MAKHSSILAWSTVHVPEEPGRLQSMGSQRVGYNLETKQQNTFLESDTGQLKGESISSDLELGGTL